MTRTPPYHVWVDLTATFTGTQAPGVLLMWRRGARGWDAWVVYASAYSTGTGSEVTVRQGWVAAHLVRPV